MIYLNGFSAQSKCNLGLKKGQNSSKSTEVWTIVIVVSDGNHKESVIGWYYYLPIIFYSDKKNRKWELRTRVETQYLKGIVKLNIYIGVF